MATGLKKAQIRVLRPTPVTIEVLFNPTEYTREWSNNYQEVPLPGLANPILQFVNGETQTLSMELFLECWTKGGDRGDVQARVEALQSALEIDPDLHAPPPVEFVWGPLTFKAVLQSMSQRFTMFDADGTPVRANLNVTFKLYRLIQEQLEHIKFRSADKTKARVMTADDTLWLMAHREYGHSREWRRIANHNRVANPRLIRAGAVLLLPPMEDRDGPSVS